MRKVYNKIRKWLADGGIYAVLGVGIISIIFAIIGFHGKHGFNLWWFLRLEVSLYIFCGWALVMSVKIYKKITEDIQNDKNTGMEDENVRF